MPPSVHELISMTPGDGISVTETDDSIRIHIRAGISQKAGCYGILLIAFCCPIALVAFAVGFGLWEFSDRPNWWAISLCAIVGLASGGPAMATVMMLVLPRGIQGDVQLNSQSVCIHDRGRVVELAWTDVMSVEVLYMKKPGRQLHAKRDWPWLRGRGDGIAIETPHGTFKTLDWWHHEVSQWLARLLSEFASVSLIDDDGGQRGIREGTVSGGLPYRIPRKDLTVIGTCGLLSGLFFSWLFWPTVRDSWDARQWKSVEAVVDSIDTDEQGKSRLVVTYTYEVEGITYTNNRFQIDDDGYSSHAERRKAKLAAGDQIEVWFDSEDPEISTVERDFPVFSFLVFLVFVAMGLAGTATVVYAAIGKHSCLAEQYAKSCGNLADVGMEQQDQN